MIHNLANRMASIFVLYGECSEEDADIYAYACEAIISTIVNIIAALVIALLMGKVIEATIFTLVFTTLRRYTGGHHAKTHFKCVLTYIVILTCTLMLLSLETMAQATNIIFLVIATVSTVGIFIIAPIGHDNKPLDDTVREVAKKKGRYLSAVLWMVCIADFYIIRNGISFAISLSMLSVLGSLIYAIATRKKFYMERRSTDA